MMLFLQVMTGLAQTTNAIHFQAVDIYVDAHHQPLAAYQVEFKSKAKGAKIVGIEGGEHPAFKEAPYYDLKAIQQERVIIAAFSTDAKLPIGRTRVATIHLQVSGEEHPDYSAILETAADATGKKILADAIFEAKKSL